MELKVGLMLVGSMLKAVDWIGCLEERKKQKIGACSRLRRGERGHEIGRIEALRWRK